MNYYNENDKFASNWLCELITAKLIPDGDVDDRSIIDVEPSDIKSYTQCHFFAGIGGWSYALELSGWDADRPVWSGSCPCQSLSCAGKGLGEKDERHLWPVFYGLIEELRPPVVFGEQVASKDGREWLSGVRNDLETVGYAVGTADLPAASVGAPHKRNRLFWVAHNPGERLEGSTGAFIQRRSSRPTRSGGVGHASPNRLQGQRDGRNSGKQKINDKGCKITGTNNAWHNSIAIPCSDGKWRRVPGRVDKSTSYGQHTQKQGELRQDKPKTSTRKNDVVQTGRPVPFVLDRFEEHQYEIEPALFPLADGISGRVGLLRGAGNAIVPQVAAEFIQAYMETITT